jgi:hypothetical protein
MIPHSNILLRVTVIWAQHFEDLSEDELNYIELVHELEMLHRNGVANTIVLGSSKTSKTENPRQKLPIRTYRIYHSIREIYILPSSNVFRMFPPFIKLGLPNLKSYHTIIPYHVMSYTILNFCIQEHTNTPGSGPTASAGEPRRPKTKTPSTYAVGFQSSDS